jgi:hypothetical protein
MGALLTCPNRLSSFPNLWFYQGQVRASHACKLPIALMLDSRFARCLQGGGVVVFEGTVAISSCTISGNHARFVRARTLESSHRPHGDSRFSRCLQGGGVHVNRGSVTITSSSIYGNAADSVRAHAQVPIAPMGTLLTCLPRLTLAQLRTLRSTTGSTCHRDLANFPSPSCETHVLLVVGRAAVFLSGRAQCQS